MQFLSSWLNYLPKIKGSYLFTPSLLGFVIFLGYYLFQTNLKDTTNYYETGFLFAGMILGIKLFVYNFGFFQNIFNYHQHKASHLTFNLLAVISEVYLMMQIPKNLSETSVPDKILLTLIGFAILWALQLVINQGLKMRNIIIVQVLVYLLGLIIINVFNAFLLENFYLTLRFFQLLGSVAILTEILMLLQVNRFFLNKIQVKSNN